MSVLIKLIAVIILQCIHSSNHRVVHFKYIQYYLSVISKGGNNKLYIMQGFILLLISFVGIDNSNTSLQSSDSHQSKLKEGGKGEGWWSR